MARKYKYTLEVYRPQSKKYKLIYARSAERAPRHCAESGKLSQCQKRVNQSIRGNNNNKYRIRPVSKGA